MGVLIFSFIGVMAMICSSSGYSEVYNWTGPVTIPSDGRKYIESGSVLVQLSSNNSIERTVNIHDSVNITLDCSHLLPPVIIPVVHRNVQITWSFKTQLYSDKYARNNLTDNEKNSGIIIFGEHRQFLRIPRHEYHTTAKISLTDDGDYTCSASFDLANPLSGSIFRQFSLNSTARVRLIGSPPVINRTEVQVVSDQHTIGHPLCYANSDSYELAILCYPVVSSTSPITFATYTFNGQPLNLDYFRASRNRIVPGANNLVEVFLEDIKHDGIEGNLTCTLGNRFGNDTATTLIKNMPAVAVSFTASISGTSGSKCNGTMTKNVICPEIGDTVELNCSSIVSYNISGPNSQRTALNKNISFVVGSNDYGSYSCVPHSQCGPTRTIVLKNENTTAAVQGVWKVGNWSNCSQTCGDGLKERTVTCVHPVSQQSLSSSLCSSSSMPQQREACNLKPCPEYIGCLDVFIGCDLIKQKNLCTYSTIKYMCCKTCTADN